MSIQIEALERTREDGKINWITAGFMTAFHVGAVAAIFFFTWKALFVSLVLWWIAGGFGIGMGYHRLLTHRGYKTPKWVEYFLTICGTLALEGGPIFWVATHRIHHQFSDHEGDPHSPRDGKWWAHMGWILMGKSLHQDTETLSRYVPDLAKSKTHIWLTKYHYVPVIVVGVALFAIGGWPFLMWGMFFRTVVGLDAKETRSGAPCLSRKALRTARERSREAGCGSAGTGFDERLRWANPSVSVMPI